MGAFILPSAEQTQVVGALATLCQYDALPMRTLAELMTTAAGSITGQSAARPGSQPK